MALVTAAENSRVMVFIDIRNLIKGSKAECPGPFLIDFVTMTKQLIGGRNLRGAYIFDGTGISKTDENTIKFHKCLERQGFRLIIRDSCDTDERQQKEVDVAMACEMLLHAVNDHYDTAIVVTGDRDFVPAIEHIQRYGKTVEVASFENCRSAAITRASDRFHNLSTMPIMMMAQPAEEVPEQTEIEQPVEIEQTAEIFAEVN